jgi:hypothetical protein
MTSLADLLMPSGFAGCWKDETPEYRSGDSDAHVIQTL